ncbi:hypothetical protein E4T56_gene19632 [Termitomyces sp. T112]|nr:hypothetical protein E4T56_gene19632 [Termitomyces sp. T112]
MDPEPFFPTSNMTSPNDTPPPYPGSNSFPLLSYDETTAADDAADSLRLPPYQPRTTRRYHPYLRVNNRPRNFFSRHEATSTLSAAVNVPTTPVITSSFRAVDPPPLLSAHNTELGPEEQHRRRIDGLFHVIPDFERDMRQALAAAQCQECCADPKDSTDTDKSATN